MDELINFERGPDYSPDAGSELLFCNAEFYYARKIPRIGIGPPSLQRGVVLKWSYSSRAVGTPYMRSTECPALL